MPFNKVIQHFISEFIEKEDGTMKESGENLHFYIISFQWFTASIKAFWILGSLEICSPPLTNINVELDNCLWSFQAKTGGQITSPVPCIMVVGMSFINFVFFRICALLAQALIEELAYFC